MLRLLYNIAGMLLMPFISAYYILYSLIKKRKIYHMLQRIGIYHESCGRPCVHIHCVSLGEAMIGYKIGKSIKDRYSVLYTTITDSGFKYLLGQDDANVAAFPLDNYPFVKSFLKNHEIAASIFVETELWPEYIIQAKQAGIKLYLINARLSERSFPKYRSLRFFFGPILNSFDRILVQSGTEVQRFSDLGVDDDRILEAGNIKYDLSDFDEGGRIEGYQREFGIRDGNIVIVAGSTFEKEEDILTETFNRLKGRYDNLKLIIAPRHPHRFDSVYSRIANKGFITVKRKPFPKGMQDWDVLVINTIGELKYIYALADIAFVGGSLVKIGGHNILEPAYWSKAIITGRYYHNFSRIINDFRDKNAVIIADDADDLYNAMIRLLDDEEYRSRLGENAKNVLDSNRGALDKTQRLIIDDIDKDIQKL